MNSKILVVDDEKNIRFFLEQLLKRDGYEVTAVENGELAVAAIDKEEFDVVLLDVMMPGISGMEVLAVLHEKWPNTVVILLTAHASLETAVYAMRHGAHDYLFKPCEANELRESLRKGLQKRQQIMQQYALLNHLEQNLVSGLEKLRTMAGKGLPDASMPVETTKIDNRFLQKGKLIIDLLRHVTTVDEQLVELSPIETNLLIYLAKESPRTIPSQELVQQVLGYKSESWEASEIIRAHMYRIRQKISSASSQTKIIRTVRGIGYAVDS